RRLAQRGAHRARERLEVLRELLLELGRDVDVLVELVDEVDGDRVPHHRVLDELLARVPPRVVVEQLAVEPRRQHRRAADHGREDDEDPDDRAPAAAEAGRVGGGCVVGHRYEYGIRSVRPVGSGMCTAASVMVASSSGWMTNVSMSPPESSFTRSATASMSASEPSAKTTASPSAIIPPTRFISPSSTPRSRNLPQSAPIPAPTAAAPRKGGAASPTSAPTSRPFDAPLPTVASFVWWISTFPCSFRVTSAMSSSATRCSCTAVFSASATNSPWSKLSALIPITFTVPPSGRCGHRRPGRPAPHHPA